jgi:type III pantothenate kinase
MNMVVVFDLGNSDLVFGVFDQGALIATGRTNSNRYKSEDEYAHTLRELLFSKGVNVEQVSDIIMSSVVPQLTTVVIRSIISIFGFKPLLVAPGVKTGLKIKADHPAEVGADLVADCVGALNRYPLPAIIVDFGSATKICAMDEDGAFIGCTIGPGVRISADALVRTASQLPNINYRLPKKVIGTNTPDSMNSGVLYGAAAMMDGLIDRFQEEMGSVKTIIATGGLAPIVVLASRKDIILDRDLILYGLYEINRRNCIKEEKEQYAK